MDQLSLTFPNQTFVRIATSLLNHSGYTVDYYPGEKVTVDFYRNLPAHGYGVIILRVHSASPGQGVPFTGLFSSESYSSTKYALEQVTDQVAQVTFFDNGPTYFGISSLFVKEGMTGRFDNATIIMMGCNGISSLDMAEAFTQKGAGVYVSWNNYVTASHTDVSTALLLQHRFVERERLGEAISQVMKEVGPDPLFDSQLLYYPAEAM